MAVYAAAALLRHCKSEWEMTFAICNLNRKTNKIFILHE